MAQQAIGMIETRGLVALVEATDAMLKAANVELVGPMVQVGNALVTATVVGDVAAVKAATEEVRGLKCEVRGSPLLLTSALSPHTSLCSSPASKVRSSRPRKRPA